MKSIRILTAFLFFVMSTATLAQNNVFLTMDPDTTNPTVVSEPNAGAAPMVFRSMDYMNTPPAPEAYVLIFDSGFVGKYQTTGGFTQGIETPIGVMFQSAAATYPIPSDPGPPVPVQEVRIKLLTGAGIAHPPGGYKYSVLMGSKVLDPRVVPR